MVRARKAADGVFNVLKSSVTQAFSALRKATEAFALVADDKTPYLNLPAELKKRTEKYSAPLNGRKSSKKKSDRYDESGPSTGDDVSCQNFFIVDFKAYSPRAICFFFMHIHTSVHPYIHTSVHCPLSQHRENIQADEAAVFDFAVPHGAFMGKAELGHRFFAGDIIRFDKSLDTVKTQLCKAVIADIWQNFGHDPSSLVFGKQPKAYFCLFVPGRKTVQAPGTVKGRVVRRTNRKPLARAVFFQVGKKSHLLLGFFQGMVTDTIVSNHVGVGETPEHVFQVVFCKRAKEETMGFYARLKSNHPLTESG